MLTSLLTHAQALDLPSSLPPAYPSKPIRVIVGITTGGGLDMMVRLAAKTLSEHWSVPVIVDNRPGGGTLIAMDLVAQAPNDGYTFLGASETLMLNGVLKRTTLDVRQAFIPVVQLTTQPYVLVINPALAINTVRELIAYGKAHPMQLSYGSQGMGTTGHISWERFNRMSGIQTTHVPYKGTASALIDVLAGHIQMTFSTISDIEQNIKAGKLRALALTGTHRFETLPQLPTIAESGVPGFESHNTYGYLAPARTPLSIVDATNKIIREKINKPAIKKSILDGGSEVVPPATAQAFKAKFALEYDALDHLIQGMKINFRPE